MVIQYNNLPFKLAVINDFVEVDFLVEGLAFCDFLEVMNNCFFDA